MNQIKEPLRKISAVIITYNEEKNIARCIDSLIGIVDEIVVIDSFSTDKTAQICKIKEVKFIQREWEGYSKSKNYGNEQALYDLILSIDADEALDEVLKQSILEIKNKKEFADAFSMNRKTNFCGKWIKHSGWYPDKKMRIWNRQDGNWQGDIHENVIFKDSIKIDHLKGDLLHYSFHTISEYNLQIEKFSSLAAHSAYIKGKKTSQASIYIHAFSKFLKKFIVNKGFLDGWDGLYIALSSGYYTMLKYRKLYQFKNGDQKK